MTICPWRSHCLWLLSSLFTKSVEEPTRCVRFTPVVISNIHEGKMPSEHFGNVADFSDQHYQ